MVEVLQGEGATNPLLQAQGERQIVFPPVQALHGLIEQDLAGRVDGRDPLPTRSRETTCPEATTEPEGMAFHMRWTR